MPDVRVREATAEDLPAVMSLWRRLEEDQGRFRVMPVAASIEERARGFFTAAIADADSALFVAEAAGEIAGMALVKLESPSRMSDERSADIGRVVVEPAWRRRGVARALIAAAEGFARARGARWISAKIFSGNAEALAFWAREGFEPHYEQRLRRLD